MKNKLACVLRSKRRRTATATDQPALARAPDAWGLQPPYPPLFAQSRTTRLQATNTVVIRMMMGAEIPCVCNLQ